MCRTVPTYPTECTFGVKPEESNVNKPMEDCIKHFYAARLVTKECTPVSRTSAGDAIAEWKKNKMSYFFAVLEDRLGIRERTYGGTETGNGVLHP